MDLRPVSGAGPSRPALAFISTELHKAFKPFFSRTATHKEKESAREAIAGRLRLIATV
jgi:glutathione S-transferase